MLCIKDLRCEYRKNPLGIDTPSPRLSWKLESGKPGTMQAAYQVQVACDSNFADLLWDTGRTGSEQSIQLAYAGKDLSPLSAYYWRAKVWDNHGRESGWATAGFETGFMGKTPWQAKWITCGLPKNPPDDIPVWMLRRDFAAGKKVVRARAYATALGLYALSINGKPADDTLMNPGWTSYNDWMQYQAYDVTGHVQQGDNTLEVLVGEGWYNGEFCFSHQRNNYGDKNALLLELHLDYEDGTREVICSDTAFKASTGPILFSGIYDGEVYDARLEGEEHRDWQPVSLLEHPTGNLTASVNLPVRPIEEIKPIAVIKTPKGETVIDMGQNMVGFLRFRVRGEAGQRVVLKHAEVLDKDGNFYFDNIRAAKQEITYTCKGGGVEEFSPHFTFQGFRMVKVVEYPGEVSLDDFTGVVVHTEMPPTGTFSCSDPMLNQLQHNILWGQKGNFVDVPTDCPQRDERLGWTADAQVFMGAACFNMDCALFFTKWLRDLRADQFANGAVPFVIPNIMPKDWSFSEEWPYDHASATWGDAATIAPWVIYQVYGDERILEESYGSMTAWVRFIQKEAGGSHIWNTGPQLGDWVALDAYEGSYLGATPTDLIATAYYAYSTGLLAKTARVLGKDGDAEEYEALYQKIVKAFRGRFMPQGKITADTQTAYILPLVFNFVEGEERKNCIDGLAAHLERNDGHLTTGFVGTPFICHALSENGREDLAFALLFKEDFPSWLYQVKKGATTVWEHWDGIKEDGSFWSPDMNSFNHYAYGSIGDWLYGVIAGIKTDPTNPGYKRSILRPTITSRLEHVDCALETVYGRLSSSWKRQDGTLEVTVEIPANTTAVLYLPCADVSDVQGPGELTPEADSVKVALGSGTHRFTCKNYTCF